jgi:hypothetical protein
MQANEQCTIHSADRGTYTYNQLNCHFNQRKIIRVPGINWGPIGCSRGILCQAKGDYLDRVHSDQKVLEVIRWGRLVPIVTRLAQGTIRFS